MGGPSSWPWSLQDALLGRGPSCRVSGLCCLQVVATCLVAFLTAPQTGWLEAQIYPLSVLEGQKPKISIPGLKSRCGRAVFLLKALGESLFLAFSSGSWACGPSLLVVSQPFL